MPVRWLYVLKNGQLTTPSSGDASGNVTFTATDPQPSTANPVVGRIAFWADDETSKVNINTAGYAKNDESYWTYWDAPNLPTKDEFLKLNAQPWTNEFLRYPGHPATTGLNLVFEGVSLTANQTASLTPRYNDGGTLGGNNTANSGNATALAIKTARLFPTVDEMFYNPARGAAATGISSDILEARRFFLTATSRAPETTLLDTPKVTLWPVWQDAATRSATDKLIAFCSTIGSGTSEQPFYFVRSNASRTDELTAIAQNSKLYSYLQTLTSRSLPGVGTTSFQTKYASEPVSRDQILTSFYDAIRLTNLWDRRAGSVAYTKDNMGWVNYTLGPNNTFSLGRNPTLQEVNVIFFNQGNATTADHRAFLFFSLNVPTVGSVPPGQNFRMRVTGLTQLTANGTPIFTNNVWENSADTTGTSPTAIRAQVSSGLGGRIPAWINSVRSGVAASNSTVTMKVDGIPLPLQIGLEDTRNQAFMGNLTAVTNNTGPFDFEGGPLTIELFAPATSTTAYQTFNVNLPSATVEAPKLSYVDVTPAPPLPKVRVSPIPLTQRFASARFMRHNYEQGDLYDRKDATDTILGVATSDGDMRGRAIRQSFSTADFRENAAYQTTTSIKRAASTLAASAVSTASITDGRVGRLVQSFTRYHNNVAIPFIPSGVVVSAFDAAGNWQEQTVAGEAVAGDWDNGIGGQRDGSFSPKPDEGIRTQDLPGTGPQTSHNYFSAFPGFANAIAGLFTPNRQVPSAAIYGNLPTGRWRTLLFRPARAWHMGGTNHFGATSPADMYLLDLFHMPIVEPYAISEPFSTAGKINMNSQMVPFSSYVTRETALHALLASTRLTAYNSVVNVSGSGPNSVATGGLGNSAVKNNPDVATRFPLKINETLKGFRERYDGTDGAGRRVFVSPAEICSLDLVPDTSASNAALFGYGTITKANLASFWSKNVMTGDNSRERPYAHLLPRLTTKSNSYTVHVTAQALAPGPGATGWQEGKGKILSEWRGAYTIERYVDPNDARFSGPGAPDFLSGTQPVGPYYKFRILGARRFNP